MHERTTVEVRSMIYGKRACSVEASIPKTFSSSRKKVPQAVGIPMCRLSFCSLSESSPWTELDNPISRHSTANDVLGVTCLLA